jgi:hypothetical protein
MSYRTAAATRAIAAALTTAGVLTTLTACSDSSGSDDDRADSTQSGSRTDEPADEPTEEPTEEPTGSRQTPEEDPPDSSGPPDDGIDRPDVQVAEDLEMIFERPDTGDPVADEVLADNERHIRAVYEVVTTHDTENSAIEFYAREQALLNETSFATRAVQNGVAAAGVMRFYDREVTSLEGDTAIIVFCRDFTEVYTKNVATGEVVEAADPNALPTHYVARLVRNDDGVWQAVSSESEMRSRDC